MIADRLNYGDTIGIISPSSIAGPEKYKHVISVLNSWALRLKQEKIFIKAHTVIRKEMERAEDLNNMFSDADVKWFSSVAVKGGNELLHILI